MPAPEQGTFPAFTEKYVSLVTADTVAEMINSYSSEIVSFFESISPDKYDYSYGPGKWTIKTVVAHLTDTERIFGYRALRMARLDKLPLAGFDENSFAAASDAANRSWNDLITEFKAVRRSTDLLFLSFTPEQLAQTGTTGGLANSVNAICYITYGHLLHHINILKERYL